MPRWPRSSSSLRILAAVSAVLLGSVLAETATLPSGFSEQTFTGISQPTGLAMAPDGRVFVAQQCGAIRVIKSGQLLSSAFATLPVSCTDERGLHGIAFDPSFPSNGYVYVRYTRASPLNNVIARLQASATNPDVAAGPPVVIFVVPYNNNNVFHHGGGILFGADGKLYSGFGDHQSGSGQNLANLWGKVVRLNPDGTIPTDNPFYNTTSGDNRAICAYGFRNPFAMAVQPGTGRIHVNDVGNTASNGREEINVLSCGNNYNWPASEGPGSYFSYNAASWGGNAIVGGTFYNPATVMFPSSYVGRYFFSDYGGGWIRSITGSGSPGTLMPFASGISGPTDVETHSDGSLWYTARNSSAVRRIFTFPTPVGSPTPTPTQTGPTPTPTPTAGPPPACVIRPLPGVLEYKGGDTLCFEGECSDAGGILPPSALRWDVVFHHNTHTHPGAQFVGVNSICFQVPRDGEWDPEQWWRVHLIATSSNGATGATSVDSLPRKQTLTLDSSPAGMQVAADGVTGPAPLVVQAVVGVKRILDTIAPQPGGYFQSWSDGGARRHDIYMPDAPTIYTATFSTGYTEITPPCGIGVTASTSDSNGPCNVVDNDLATRWSGNGDGAWVKLDLGSTRQVGHINVAVYQGNIRRNRFDLQVSTDDLSWTTVHAGESSGTTTQEETYDFADVSARYVRYLGHGNIGSANPTMNSVTEISIFGSTGCAACPTPTPTSTPTATPTPTATATPSSTPTPTPVTPTPTPGIDDCVEFVPTPGVGIIASTHDGNVPANAVDGNFSTRWSANGDGQWLQVDLGTQREVCYVKIAFYGGNTRQSRFDLQVTNAPAGPWINLLSGALSGGTTTGLETFDFGDVSARYLRYLGHGNTLNLWNSILELKVFVKPLLTPTATPTPVVSPTSTPTPMPTPTMTPTGPPPPFMELTPTGAGVTASTHDGNLPANTVDNSLSSRWSGNGDGAWLRLDLGNTHTVTHVRVAVYNGHTRRNRFDLQVSTAAAGPWTNVWTGESSGTTTGEETYDFADVPARYVRYVGHMSNVGTFNSVTEVSVFGSP